MRRIGTFEDRDDELRLAGLGPSSPRSAATEPVLLGAIVALIVSDLGADRLFPGVQTEGGRRRVEIHDASPGQSRVMSRPIGGHGVLRLR